jgi:hypothetical protein
VFVSPKAAHCQKRWGTRGVGKGATRLALTLPSESFPASNTDEPLAGMYTIGAPAFPTIEVTGWAPELSVGPRRLGHACHSASRMSRLLNVRLRYSVACSQWEVVGAVRRQVSGERLVTFKAALIVKKKLSLSRQQFGQAGDAAVNLFLARIASVHHVGIRF